MIKIKKRQEKTTGQKTLLDLKHQGSIGGCLLADSQIELSKSLSQKGDVARVCTNPGSPFMQIELCGHQSWQSSSYHQTRQIP
jgi:hypothetical protein